MRTTAGAREPSRSSCQGVPHPGGGKPSGQDEVAGAGGERLGGGRVGGDAQGEDHPRSEQGDSRGEPLLRECGIVGTAKAEILVDGCGEGAEHGTDVGTADRRRQFESGQDPIGERVGPSGTDRSGGVGEGDPGRRRQVEEAPADVTGGVGAGGRDGRTSRQPAADCGEEVGPSQRLPAQLPVPGTPTHRPGNSRSESPGDECRGPGEAGCRGNRPPGGEAAECRRDPGPRGEPQRDPARAGPHRRDRSGGAYDGERPHQRAAS